MKATEYIEKEFEIRAYGKGELALLYAPATQSPKNAVRTLNRWIDQHADLRRQLKQMGLTPSAKNFTPAQVKAIITVLGPP